MKMCSMCKEEKPVDDFYTAKTNSGLMKRCKSCASPYIRDFVEKDAPWDEERYAALSKHKSFISSRRRNKYRSNLERRRELLKAEHKAKLKKDWETDLDVQAKQMKIIEWARRKDEQTNQQAEEGNA